MTINDEIIAIANQIANDGQQPSIARIKTKLKNKVPLPKIISVMKSWQHDPNFTAINTSADQPTVESGLPNTEIDEKISQAVSPLLHEIAELKNQLNNLKMEIAALKQAKQ